MKFKSSFVPNSASFSSSKRLDHVQRRQGRCSRTATRLLSHPRTLIRCVRILRANEKDHSACSSDRDFLRPIIFAGTPHIHLEVFILLRQPPIGAPNLICLPLLPLPSTIYTASSVRSLTLPPSPNTSSVQGSFIDLGSPPMSPTSEIGSFEYQPVNLTRDNSPHSPNPSSRSASPLSKPPVPTTPKPVFNRPHSLRRSGDGRPRIEDPPATVLSSTERAELVKKTRKLTQLFGQTPGPDLASLSPVLLSPDVRKGHRVAASISNPLHPSDKGAWPPPDETVYLNINGRRHSTPLSPTTVSTMWGSNEDDSILDLHDQQSFRSNKHARLRLSRHGRPSSIPAAPSPMSFIDLSDDDSAAETPKDTVDNQAPFSGDSTVDDTASLLTLTSSEAHEEELRRKREKLVKLHRFLGSRVPTDLALGLDLSQSHSLLPSPAPGVEEEDTRKKFRIRRRRSSSYAEYTKPLTAREDRMKSELNIQEKALNVRRAAKMEKVGTPRPVILPLLTLP